MKRIRFIFKRTSFKYALKYLIFLTVKRLAFKDLKISFSEFSEDLLVIALFNFKEQGTFVDVGCNYPVTNSVTFQLYMKGWSGVNIDGNPELITMYHSIRPLDYSICELIDESVREVEFIRFKENKLNTINPDHVFEWNKEQVIGKEVRVTKKLSTILESKWPDGKEIDLLTIDVEGMDLAVLKSHNFEKFPAKLIVIEMHGFDLLQPTLDPIYNYLQLKNYKLKGFSGLNGYFLSNK